MTTYVEGARVEGEKVIRLGRISLGAFWHLIVFGILLAPVGIAWVRYRSTEVAVTTRRVIVKTGFISRKTVELNLNKVESLQAEQCVIARMPGYGTLVIAGTGITHERNALHQWMRQQRLKIPDGSATARAIDYSLKPRPGALLRS